MATTTIVQTPKASATFKISVADVDLGTYATGGVSVTPANLGLNSVVFAIVTVKSVSGTVNHTGYYYDVANSKILAYDETPAQVANSAALSSNVVRVVAFGT